MGDGSGSAAMTTGTITINAGGTLQGNNRVASVVINKGGIRHNGDFRHYELVHETKTEGNFTPRHGGIIRITDAEYKRLINNYQQ